MIRLSAIIRRMRSRCPSFQNRVGGTASFAAVTAAGEEADLPVPHCFVVPMTEQSTSVPSTVNIGAREDKRRETFATVICVDNTVQGGGKTAGVMSLIAVDQVSAIEEEIEDAFDDWVPHSRYDAIQFHQGEHIGMDAKRLWHQFTWIVEWLDIPSEQIGVEDQIRNLTEGDDSVGARNVTDIHMTAYPLVLRYADCPMRLPRAGLGRCRRSGTGRHAAAVGPGSPRRGAIDDGGRGRPAITIAARTR